MENLGTGEWIVIGLSLIIGLFFVIGNWMNNQRGNEAMLWLRRGLAGYGELQSSRFNAPSSKGIPFQIVPSEKCPFQNIRGNLALERRENLPLWIFQLIRKKRDVLIWTSDLKSVPAMDIHLTHESFLPRVKANKNGGASSAKERLPIASSPFFITGITPPMQVERVTQDISSLPSMIRDIQIQRKSPHLTFQVHLSQVLRNDPETFFQSLLKWIELN